MRIPTNVRTPLDSTPATIPRWLRAGCACATAYQPIVTIPKHREHEAARPCRYPSAKWEVR
jgi:hypothetical protein